MDFLPHVEVNHTVAEAIARGLFAVAKADGAHERELAMISSFWSETGGSSNSLAELMRRDAISPAQLAVALHTEDERVLFLKTALLLAHADGKVTAAERSTIGSFATALKLDEAKLATLENSVKEFLLSQLSALHNTEATTAVAKKLKL
jgi:uncharacterized membrane protein YebE (DUF533 family)